MSKVKYDKSLDSDSALEKVAEFYDAADLNDYFSGGEELRKISININVGSYNLAKRLAGISGVGYQNIIKMAMSVGLVKLLEDLRVKKNRN